jgi:hypothetical protein
VRGLPSNELVMPIAREAIVALFFWRFYHGRHAMANHVLIMNRNPLYLTLAAPKEMLQGGLGDFYFYEMLLGGSLWL